MNVNPTVTLSAVAATQVSQAFPLATSVVNIAVPMANQVSVSPVLSNTNNNEEWHEGGDDNMSSCDEDDYVTVTGRRRWKRRLRGGHGDDTSGGSKENPDAGGATKGKPVQAVLPVVVACDSEAGKAGWAKLDALTISKGLMDTVGNVKEVKRLREGRILVVPFSLVQQDQLLDMQVFCGMRVKTSLPLSASRIRGVIRGVYDTISEEILLENLQHQGVVNLKRLPSKKYTETNGADRPGTLKWTVLLDFQTATLPSRVFIGFEVFRVTQYVPTPLQCWKCNRFGHTKGDCRGRLRCAKCGGDHEAGECTMVEHAYRCPNCGGNHAATDNNCSNKVRAKSVVRKMVEDCISYRDAVVAVREVEKKATQDLAPKKVQPQNVRKINAKQDAVNKNTCRGITESIGDSARVRTEDGYRDRPNTTTVREPRVDSRVVAAVLVALLDLMLNMATTPVMKDALVKMRQLLDGGGEQVDGNGEARTIQ